MGHYCTSIPSSASRQHDVASNGVKAQLPHAQCGQHSFNESSKIHKHLHLQIDKHDMIDIFMHAHFNADAVNWRNRYWPLCLLRRCTVIFESWELLNKVLVALAWKFLVSVSLWSLFSCC